MSCSKPSPMPAPPPVLSVNLATNLSASLSLSAAPPLPFLLMHFARIRAALLWSSATSSHMPCPTQGTARITRLRAFQASVDSFGSSSPSPLSASPLFLSPPPPIASIPPTAAIDSCAREVEPESTLAPMMFLKCCQCIWSGTRIRWSTSLRMLTSTVSLTSPASFAWNTSSRARSPAFTLHEMSPLGVPIANLCSGRGRYIQRILMRRRPTAAPLSEEPPFATEFSGIQMW
mmetsp:Transcript_24631/g.43755  ORF Transcript_24631/g.43755 Transcript_24631/m.43755 type:complete len:232 (+) Transcript_24631:5888-6583(+)